MARAERGNGRRDPSALPTQSFKITITVPTTLHTPLADIPLTGASLDNALTGVRTRLVHMCGYCEVEDAGNAHVLLEGQVISHGLVRFTVLEDERTLAQNHRRFVSLMGEIAQVFGSDFVYCSVSPISEIVPEGRKF